MHNILGTSGSGGLMEAVPLSAIFTDPRTSRFGGFTTQATGHSPSGSPYMAPGAATFVLYNNATYAYAMPESKPNNPLEWIDANNDVLMSNRPTANAGYPLTAMPNLGSANGWYGSATTVLPGLLSQNATTDVADGLRYSGAFGTDPEASSAGSAFYYCDADNVVRRASGAYAVGTTTTTGLPIASTQQPGPTAVTNQSQSRPWILHRPFRSVAELGYVFSGTPWKNLDFFTPESGDGGLLDVFCINDSSTPGQLVAGKVNLNTAQQPVLKALLAGAYRDEQSPTSTVLDASIGGLCDTIATSLVSRTSATTTGTGGKLTNLGDLVGRWITGSATAAPIDGSKSYDGFTADLSTILSNTYGANTSMTNIQRFREAAIRPLAAAGSTRVWNLMIDLIAQTGRYPQGTSNLASFMVEGEQRYWVHIAIDRFTGKVLDKQVEVVKE
jgi:hypothetical protein